MTAEKLSQSLIAMLDHVSTAPQCDALAVMQLLSFAVTARRDPRVFSLVNALGRAYEAHLSPALRTTWGALCQATGNPHYLPLYFPSDDSEHLDLAVFVLPEFFRAPSRKAAAPQDASELGWRSIHVSIAPFESYRAIEGV